ncbi:MAG TPA: peptidase domain-containing ABC transporter [Kofleriaceae bacterium]|nr:peptidase domain-containing ABC transporter [Kofleriaceae bacterium]
MATDDDLGDDFPAVKRLRLRRRRRAIPFIPQVSGTECGAACLAMVLSYHGKDVPLDAVRDATGTDRDGTSALRLAQAARSYGMQARCVSFEVEALSLIDAGTILHWDFKHFVVFEKLDRDTVQVVDPEFGRRRVSMAEFRRAFTGVALQLQPGEGFLPERKERGVLGRYVRQMLMQPALWLRILFISLLVQLFALSLPILTSAVVDGVVPRGDRSLLMALGVGLLLLAVFQWLAQLLRGHLLLYLRTRLDAHMTLGLLGHLLRLPYDFFQRRSVGDLMLRLNSNATVREILTSTVLSGVLDAALALSYLVILGLASPALTGMVACLATAQALVFVVTRRRQRDLGSQALIAQAKSEEYQVEMLVGIETLKAMGAEERASEHWSHLFVDTLNVSLDRGRLQAHVDAAAGALHLASPLLVMGFGALLVLDGGMSLGTLLGLSAVAAGILNPLANLVTTAAQLQVMSTYLERIADIWRTATEQDRQTVSRAPSLSGAVILEDLSFRYGPASAPVVRDVSATVLPGQFVAIVGHSGSGKSTLARLLAGLYPPGGGRILYDGLDLAELDLQSVRHQLGYVPQNPSFFAQSIRANIALADPTLPLERVVAAAKLAQIHDEIMDMPMQYDTPLLNGAASLSGGQRQRVALARALVTAPAVLLLDEATSALDAVTEARVQAALIGLSCTRIVIAHRLSTVVGADQILVMAGGTIAESGTHGQLLAVGSIYADLVATQLGGERPARRSAPHVPPREASVEQNRAVYRGEQR